MRAAPPEAGEPGNPRVKVGDRPPYTTPMIRLLQSNNMSRLIEAFVARGQDAPGDPFQPLTVIVQSFGMGQWLKLQLAETAGIAANIDCVLPANFVWRLYRQVLADLDLPEASPFAVESLTWHLLRILPQCKGAPYARVRHFLEGPGDPQVRGYQLARRIASLYDQYLIYRPEWILGWEAGEDAAAQPWQSDLWRRLCRDPALTGKHHRAGLHKALLARLDRPDALAAGIPGHLSVFGLSALPVLHLQTLHALSRHSDIDLYFMNPCQHYWGDVISERDLARRSVRALVHKDAELTDDDYLDTGNPLLASMGKQGREFLELLLGIDDLHIDEYFEPAAGENMLAAVKRDVLNLEFGGEFASDVEPTPRPVDAGDMSIQLHACHSKLREVEVLYDQLLAMIRTDPQITAADIIVMMPNVGDYAPFIEAVFQDSMYYAIADRSLNQESPALVAFTTLLALPASRLTSTEVMDLLEIPIIARKFDLREEDLTLLTRWVQDAGIRWELDGHSKQVRWQLPASDQNTWHFGLDRLLLGYAMESDAGIWDGILPFDMEAGDAILLGTLCHFVELLAAYRSRLETARTAGEWRAVVVSLLNDFFEPAAQEELDLGLIRELMIRLETETAETGFEDKLSAKLVRHWLEEELSTPQQGRGFISGGITFATLVPMRSVPFKVVCLLGMNDGEYPREDRPLTFDLMNIDGYRKGDRSKRHDDRYLFLEALLSAQEYFYVSYEGKSVKDNQEKPPSVLVSEFVDYVTRIFDHDPVVFHPLQPFSDEYFDPGRPRLVTFRPDWYEALLAFEPQRAFADVTFEVDPDLAAKDIEQLVQFFRHPARYYLRNRLGVYFDDDEADLDDTESFALDGLERYQLAESALSTLLRGEPVEAWREQAIASGAIMDSRVGQSQLDRELARARLVFDQLDVIARAQPERITATLTLPDGHALRGNIDNVYGDVIVNYRSGTLRKRQLLDIWIAHLFANATCDQISTITLSTQPGKAVRTLLEPVGQAESTAVLGAMLALFTRGLASPLPFLPETSFAYASAIAKGEPDNRAIDRALRYWHEDTPGSEGADRNYRRLFTFPDDFDDRFREIALAVYEPIIARWTTEK